MSIEIVIQQTKSEMSPKELTRVEFIKQFNKIVLAIEKTKVRFNILEFVNDDETDN
jgi:hypothetical protein